MEDQKPLPPAPSLGKSINDVFTSPSEIFQNIKDKASAPALWVVPLIISLFLVIISVIVIFTNESLKSEMKSVQSKAIQKMVDQGKLTQEQADQAESRAESMGSMMIVFGIIGGLIFMALYFFGGALFLWLTDRVILKSNIGYNKHLEMYGIASWIGVLGGIITLLMMIGMNTMAATPSAALAVMGNYDPTNNLHKLLTSLNVFSIWETVILGIGLSKFSGKSTGMGIGVAFVLWVVWVAISILLGFTR